MLNLSVKEILETTRGNLISGNIETAFSNISTDSRSIRQEDLFIALKGKNFDGHNFIEEAAEKGACGAVVCINPLPASVCPIGQAGKSETNSKFQNFILIQVKDTLKAYGDISHWYRMKFNIPFIGITGSNGKTTVKEMIYKVLSSRFYVLRNEGTENNLIGLPKTLLKLNREYNMAVLELGTNHFGEIKRLSRILKPTVGVITNIGPSHLEFLKSTKGVFKEKRELLRSLDKDEIAILNADDEFLPKIKNLKCRQITFGMDSEADVRATKIFQDRDGMEFTVNERYDFKINVLGRHNVYNALIAIALGLLYKVDYENIYRALLGFQPQKGRLCLRKIGDIDIIDDTYNSNPESLKVAVKVLSECNALGRKIFVCGDMLELGRHAVKFHTQIGKLIREAGLDCLISVGNFSEIVRDSAIMNGMSREAVFSCRDNASCIRILRETLKEGDVLLLKGSRLIRLDEVVDALSSFIPVKRDMVRV